jgi:thioredoxin reductase (NADPH)
MTDDTTRASGEPADSSATNGSRPPKGDGPGTTAATEPAQTKPFGGFAIDFSDDAGGATAPMPIDFGAAIASPVGAVASPAKPQAAGPQSGTSGAGRTESKVIIVGSGPAGLTAAIYAARANLEPIVLAGSAPGGQLMITSDVENYPGFPDGIQGPELMAAFREQAARFGTHIVDVDIDRVDFSSRPFRLWARGIEYRAEAVIVATGASALWLGLESETRLRGRGVSACATCDGFFFRDKEIIVIGGGDSAMEEATYLTKFASKVTVIHRRRELRASKIMQDRAFANPKIAWIWDTVVTGIVGTREGGVTAVKLHNKRTELESVYPTQGVFYAIGHKPNTDLFRGKLEMNDVGYIKVQEPTTRTSVPGVFAAGDLMDPIYRQAITSAGTGCRAAIDAERWLQELQD